MRKTLLITVLCLIMLAFSGVALAKEWPAKTDVPVDHIWTIEFSEPIYEYGTYPCDFYFFIFNEQGEEIRLSFREGRNENEIIFFPEEKYEPASTYTLLISNEYPLSASGKKLKESITMTFSTVSVITN